MPDSQSLWEDVRLNARARRLEARWLKLCTAYLPRAPSDSFWRFNSVTRASSPKSGWKLHVSATILTAPIVLDRVGPFLKEQRVPFKAPRSLTHVGRLNAGLQKAYSQIGKVITVYPRNDAQAVFLAQHLDLLTRGLAAPKVPFDLRFSDSGNVYYRFGSFIDVQLDGQGATTRGVYTANGALVPDDRQEPKPEWVSDPLAAHRPQVRRAAGPINPSIRVIKALTQRGKGGVYEAIDLRGSFPKLCLLKEGRRHGEVTWDGRDGAWRTRHEERVLKCLRRCGVSVPRVDSSFMLGGNYYLVMEYLAGESLHDQLARCRRRFTLPRVLDYGIQLAGFLAQMHRAGWVWRDCKPMNLIVTPGGRLAPIDFEGAAPVKRPDVVRWGTAEFAPPEWRRKESLSSVSDDLYGLGSILYLLITGHLYEPDEPIPIKRLRRSVPLDLQALVTCLLDAEPARRPSADTVTTQLNSILRMLKRTRWSRLRDLKAA